MFKVVVKIKDTKYYWYREISLLGYDRWLRFCFRLTVVIFFRRVGRLIETIFLGP